MAFISKRCGTWYLNYRGIDGAWRRKSCGKDARKADAKVIAGKYSDREFSQRHRAVYQDRSASLPLFGFLTCIRMLFHFTVTFLYLPR